MINYTVGGEVAEIIKFAICDDEPLMVRRIESCLTRYLEERRITGCSVRSFTGGGALLESGGGFDVIFLDIQMGPPDGMETARLLRRQGEHGRLIFGTVLKECVFDAFEVDACGYLLKPLEDGRFRRTMDRVLRGLEERADLVIRRGTGWESVPLDHIVYCEVLGRKVYLHRQDGTVTDYYERLEDLERRVDGRFFRCHRSYLVNLDYVRGCQAGRVMLPRGEAVPVSRLRERELRQALLRCMKGREL